MRNLIVVGVALALAGCGGSLSRFLNDVEVFSADVGKAGSAYREERDFYVSYLEGLETRALLRERPKLSDGPEVGACDAWISEWQGQWDKNKKEVDATAYLQGVSKLLTQCRLHKAVGNTTEMLQIQAGDPTPNHTRLADALQKYARNLALLANSAGDRKAFTDAAQDAKGHFLELLASARSLGVALGSESPLNIDKEVSVIGSVLIDAVGASLEARRRRALARIIEATHPAIVESASRLAAISRFYHLAALPRLAADYEGAVDQTTLSAVRANEQSYDGALKIAIARHKALIDYTRFDPGLVFDSMVTAHLALGRRLEDPEVRLAELAGSLENFSFNAEKAVGAIRAIRVKIEGRPAS